MQIFGSVALAEVINFQCCNFSQRHRDSRVAVNFFLTHLCIEAFNLQYLLYLPAPSDPIMVVSIPCIKGQTVEFRFEQA